MPVYEYYCPANHRTVEVMHGMSAQLQTWGEVCVAAEEPTGQTHPDEPVEKLLSAGMVVTRSTPDPAPMDCGNPGGCCGGGCAM
ncbi:MAG: zinc ribbon domain-containing protein [Planctomycetota bacterium]